MSVIQGVFVINGHDYTRYIKQKTGITWSRENTNSKNAGRDASRTMHPDVTSHQRKLELKMGPMPLEIGMQLEQDLESHDDGVRVQYVDLNDGVCTRLFYTTSVKSAQVQYTSEGVLLDDVSFSLISVKEATV